MATLQTATQQVLHQTTVSTKHDVIILPEVLSVFCFE